MNRRHFFLSTSATAAASAATALVGPSSDHDVPPHLDVRDDKVVAGIAIIIKRHGKKINHVIAYNLQEDWVLVYRTDPNGNIVVLHDADEAQNVKLYGGVTVEWDHKQLRAEREHRVRLNGASA